MSKDPVLLSEEGTSESQADTLGALLYADGSKTPVREQEWVDLIQAVASGDQQALHDIHGRLYGIVFTQLIQICKDHATAEELTLELFHEVWCRASQYDPARNSVVGWILNLARARALERLRPAAANEKSSG